MGTVVWWLEGLADMEAVEERVNVAKVEEAVVTETVQQGVREELVNTAVKFLENSRVQSSTLEMKREFLTKKGLTSEEIASAFSKASQVAPTQQVQVQQKMDMQLQAERSSEHPSADRRSFLWCQISLEEIHLPVAVRITQSCQNPS